MDKDNKITEVADVMNSILSDLQSEIDIAKKYENDCSSNSSTFILM